MRPLLVRRQVRPPRLSITPAQLVGFSHPPEVFSSRYWTLLQSFYKNFETDFFAQAGLHPPSKSQPHTSIFRMNKSLARFSLPSHPPSPPQRPHLTKLFSLFHNDLLCTLVAPKYWNVRSVFFFFNHSPPSRGLFHFQVVQQSVFSDESEMAAM